MWTAELRQRGGKTVACVLKRLSQSSDFGQIHLADASRQAGEVRIGHQSQGNIGQYFALDSSYLRHREILRDDWHEAQRSHPDAVKVLPGLVEGLLGQAKVVDAGLGIGLSGCAQTVAGCLHCRIYAGPGRKSRRCSDENGGHQKKSNGGENASR